MPSILALCRAIASCKRDDDLLLVGLYTQTHKQTKLKAVVGNNRFIFYLLDVFPLLLLHESIHRYNINELGRATEKVMAVRKISNRLARVRYARSI